MTFAHPWVLLLLVVPAAIVALEVLRGLGGGPGGSGWRWAGRVVMPMANTREKPRRWLERGLALATVLPAVVLAVVVCVLAGPRRIEPPRQERVLTNIEIVLDVSGSMMTPIQSGGQPAGFIRFGDDSEPTGPTRYTAAMESIREFCERRSGDAFGLTIFGNKVIRWMPLTKDLAAIRNATPFLNPAKMPPSMHGTEIGKALRFAAGVLRQQPEGDRLVILVTDGFSSDLQGNAALEVAQELAGDRIVVHAVCIGSDQPPQQLSDVVVPTGGQVFGAGTPGALSGVFAHIDRMQPSRLKPREPLTVDHFRPFVFAGLAILALHGLCLWGWRWSPW